MGHAGTLAARLVVVHIHVITSPEQPGGHGYVMSLLADLWRAAGHTVTSGLIKVLDADIGIVHIDLTTIPTSALPANPHRRPLLNANLLDISKTAISHQLVHPDDGYRGPVIIKTNANSTGSGERIGTSRWTATRIRRRLTTRLPWTMVRTLPRRYPILDDATHVPTWVWKRSDLVVERFTPERAGNDYVVRTWLFLGDQEYVVKLRSPTPIVKSSTATSHELIDDVPDEIRRHRADLRADYGKFDYVIVDGQAILLDANKTPTADHIDGPGPHLARLATGLTHFLAAGQP